MIFTGNNLPDYAHHAVLLHYYYNDISDYAHYTVFLHWLHSLRCFTSLLLKRNIWLRSLRRFSSLTTLTMLFYFATIKWKSLTTLTTLFYFTTTNPRDRTTLTTLLLSLIHQIVFPQEFQCFHKICMCHSNFTVRKFSGVLHALLPALSTTKNTFFTEHLPLATFILWILQSF